MPDTRGGGEGEDEVGLMIGDEGEGSEVWCRGQLKAATSYIHLSIMTSGGVRLTEADNQALIAGTERGTTMKDRRLKVTRMPIPPNQQPPCSPVYDQIVYNPTHASFLSS